MKITIFYEVDEKLQERRKIGELISAFNVKKLTFETDQLGEQNVHEMDMNTLETVLAIVLSKEDSDFDRVFIELLKLRLDELIKEKVRQKSYLIESYRKGELRWMDNPFNKFISEMNIGLLNNNLTRLKEGYHKEICKGLDDTWIWILEKELKSKKQAEAMKSKMWPSSDGPIHVEKMSGTHINNCIQRLEDETKKDSFEFNWLAIFYDELLRRVTVGKQTEKKLYDLYAKAIRDKKNGEKLMEEYNKGLLIFAYVNSAGDYAESYIQDMSLEDVYRATLTTLDIDYHPAWGDIFNKELRRRVENIFYSCVPINVRIPNK